VKLGIVSRSETSVLGLSNRSTEWPDGWCSKEPRRSTRSSEQVVGRETSRTSRLRSQPRGRSIEDPVGGGLVKLNSVTSPSGPEAELSRAEKLETSVSACQVSVRARPCGRRSRRPR